MADDIDLPPDVLAAFRELAIEQRGEPEEAMREAQHALGGGVFSYVIEHVGDILNRMNKDLDMGTAAYATVADKVENSLNTLQRGFESRHRADMFYNARGDGVDLKDYLKLVDTALDRYAMAHAELPVYNRAQWLAQEAAMALGEQQFRRAKKALTELLEKDLVDRATWTRVATEYELDPVTGDLLEYEG